MRAASEILRDIAAFDPCADESWLRLDELLAELRADGSPPVESVDVLLGVLERFPDSDGFGVLWSVVHGIESLPHPYEEQLRASHRRVPSEMSAIMLSRLANGVDR